MVFQMMLRGELQKRLHLKAHKLSIAEGVATRTSQQHRPLDLYSDQA
jgi:hypothetical protein